ncbi:PepSY-associated TM helix domain-containing protein [Mucilaginibacter litoreus]|uniref:PepSY-associated TM helix domain-containing protein n=1 Tax=Mucilaginibacter litoreus TaxID=1048221 RepID=A0ABW3AZ30_9SPHI
MSVEALPSPRPIVRRRSAVKKKKKQRSLFYRISAWLHLWLGLITGIVVVIVSITGAILVFEQELRVWLQPYQTVEGHGKAYLPPSRLKKVAMQQFKLPTVSAVVYQGKNRSAVVPYYGDPKRYQLIYIDPYTGKVLQSVMLKNDFYRIVLEGHYNLWLPREYGRPIVSYSTLIFIITLITGLVLWWPKKWTKNTRDRSFKIKLSGNTKRINYDSHNVLGFYTLSIALILGLTGMVYGMQWFSDAVYFTASGGTKTKHFAFEKPKVKGKDKSNGNGRKAIKPQDINTTGEEDKLFNDLVSSKTDIYWQVLTFGYPFGKKGPWTVSLAPEIGRRVGEKSTFYEQFTLKKLSKAPENGGDKFMRLNYDLHVGSVGGFFTKILAFLTCIICASLPITGFFIWWVKK